VKVLRVLFFLFVLMALGISVVFQLNSSLYKKISNGERINFLIIGTDELKYGRHADVILVLSYEPKTKFFDLISVPRDTYVGRINWRRRKLSEVFFLEYRKKKDILKVLNIFSQKIYKIINLNPEYYFIVTYSSFKKIVNLLGKIRIYIPFDMDYDDNWGNLHIHFKKGWHELNGEDALKYVRFRHTALGDRGRIKRQQEMIKLILKKAISLKTLFKVSEIVSVLKEEFYTNLNVYDFLVVFNEMRFFNFRNLRIQTLPGEPRLMGGKDFFILDNEKKEEIIDVISNSWKVNWPESKEKIKIIKIYNEKTPIIVDVWNATKRKGLAEDVSRFLRFYGIDVLEWGNWGIRKKYSVVIDRAGDLKKAEKIARILGITEIKTNIDKAKMVSCSVVIGDDFKFDEKRF